MKKKHPVRIGVLASGRGSNLQAIINACEHQEIDAHVVVVISDQPEAQAFIRAQQHRISAYAIDRSLFLNRTEFENEILNKLSEHNVELVCLAGYMRVIGKTLLNAFPERMLNIHPSLLPAFPGLNAQQQALEHKANVSGCTVHLVDDKIDHGRILLQTKVEVFEKDTVETLSARILEQEHLLYPKAIGLMIENMRKSEKH